MPNVTGCSSRYVERAGHGTRRTPTDAAAAAETTFAGRNENSEQNRTILGRAIRVGPGPPHENSRYRFTTGFRTRSSTVSRRVSVSFNRSFNAGSTAVSDTGSVTGFSPISEPISRLFSKPILLGLRSIAAGKPAGGAAWEAQRGPRRQERPPLSNSSS